MLFQEAAALAAVSIHAASEEEGWCLFPQLRVASHNSTAQGIIPCSREPLLLSQPWVMPVRAGLGPLRVTNLHLRTMLGIWGWMLCNWQFCDM